MSDRELYSRLLLAKGHGYPLSYPQPLDDLPPESRAQGIQIGDVGVLTSDGAFDPFFNICQKEDHPANRFGVPTGFETVHIGTEDVSSMASYHRPGSHVSNTRINKRRLDVDTDLDNVFSPVGAGATVEISTVSKQAAILLLPEGASRTNLRFLKTFRHQALKHAHNWYSFLDDLGCMVENGELYLVTGVDKSSSWIVGAVENASQDCNISLKIKAAQIGSAGGSYAWQWETSGAFADSGPRRLPGEDSSAQNQTVFLRGFRIAMHSLAWRKVSQAIPVVDSKPLSIFSKRWFTSFGQSYSLGTRGISRDLSGGQSRAPHDKEGCIDSPKTTRPYHPADAINEYLLRSSPRGVVAAVTHDDEWSFVLREDDETVPSESELIRRICETYPMELTSGGAYFGCPKVDVTRSTAIRTAIVAMFFACMLWSMGQFLEEHRNGSARTETDRPQRADTGASKDSSFHNITVLGIASLLGIAAARTFYLVYHRYYHCDRLPILPLQRTHLSTIPVRPVQSFEDVTVRSLATSAPNCSDRDHALSLTPIRSTSKAHLPLSGVADLEVIHPVLASRTTPHLFFDVTLPHESVKSSIQIPPDALLEHATVPPTSSLVIAHPRLFRPIIIQPEEGEWVRVSDVLSGIHQILKQSLPTAEQIGGLEAVDLLGSAVLSVGLSKSQVEPNCWNLILDQALPDNARNAVVPMRNI